MPTSLTTSAWRLLPDYVRAADDGLADPHTTPGLLRRWLQGLTSQADVALEAVDALDPITNPQGRSCAENAVTAPAPLLPFMAMVAGLLPDYAGLPADHLREVLSRPSQWRRRGSRKAIAASVAATLTGTQTVEIETHIGGDMWLMRVLVVEGEMPDRDATEAAILREKPAGVLVELLESATPHVHTIGSLAGRAGGHAHTIGQLAGRSIGHAHTIGQLAGRP
jgi:hypothetical protein